MAYAASGLTRLAGASGGIGGALVRACQDNSQIKTIHP